MVNVVVTLYRGTLFIERALNSLLEQTSQDFLVSLVQDCDGLDYTDIVDKYRQKGLIIDHIINSTNLKQGLSRQAGIDAHPECEYVMFMDQDDEYTPIAVQVLQEKIRETKADIVFSKVYCETNSGYYYIEKDHSELLTELHGEIFSVEFLIKNNVRFLHNITYAEDTSFNFMAFLSGNNVQYLDEVTYRWLNNKQSVTRVNNGEYYLDMQADFIIALSQAMMHVVNHGHQLSNFTIANELLVFYRGVMLLDGMNYIPQHDYRKALIQLGQQPYIIDAIHDGKTLQYIANKVKGAICYRDKVIFFKTSFIEWLSEWLNY